MREGSHHVYNDVVILACQSITRLLQVHCKCADDLVGALIFIFRVKCHLEELAESVMVFARGRLVGGCVIHNGNRGNDIMHWRTEV